MAIFNTSASGFNMQSFPMPDIGLMAHNVGLEWFDTGQGQNQITATGTGLVLVTQDGNVVDVTAGTINTLFVNVPEGLVAAVSLNVSAVTFFDALVGDNWQAMLRLLTQGDDLINGTDAGDVLLGGAGSDVAKGNSGDDRLVGGGGNDSLHGGLGADRMTGGAGADSFVFDTAITLGANVDDIVDFAHRRDHIVLAPSVFAALADFFTFRPSQFVAGTSAQTRAQHIIYDQATGDLFYDADGSRHGAMAVQFAHVAPGTLMTAADFTLV